MRMKNSNARQFYEIEAISNNRSMRGLKRQVNSVNGNDDTKVVHSKLRGYQTSINSVYNEEIIKAIKNLLQIKSIKEASPITEILRNIFEKNIKNMENLNKEIFSVRPNDVEEIVENIFIKQGYLVESRNSYDKKGGDYKTSSNIE